MTHRNRIDGAGRVRRGSAVRFRFDGRQYFGYHGDTLASALLANGVHLVGRSFKYHRPRGISAAGSEDPNALVQLERGPYTQPNTCATQIELYDGLDARSQNRWPSLGFDIGGINAWLARFIPSGFYYKTFMWPVSGWLFYEKFIRRAAGLGVSPREPDPDRYEQLHAHCDVLVVGAGPAGLGAALAAGRCGARVIIMDEQSEFGGSVLGRQVDIDGNSGIEWVRRTRESLGSMSNVQCVPRCTVTGYYDYNFLTALERVTDHLGPGADDRLPRQRFWKIRARRVVLASGAIERPLLFADNDRPGVMLANAVRTYINRYRVLPGRAICVLTNNDSAYECAWDAHEAGARVTIVDVRDAVPDHLAEKARVAGIEIHTGCGITAVQGRLAVRSVDIRPLSQDGRRVTGVRTRIECSIVANSGGWNPSVHLHSQSRGKLRFDTDLHSFVPAETVAINPSVSVGAACGEFSLSACLVDGHRQGKAAAQAALPAGEYQDAAGRAAATDDAPADAPLKPLWVLPTDHPVGQGPRKHFHDFQNDVTVADIMLAAREGYLSVEHLKRYTTTGMATDQGKTSNVNALAIMAGIRGLDIPAVGTTTFRPPYTPVTFGAIAGQNRDELFLQHRHTPMHTWHVEHGAIFEDVGDWKRPRYFPQAGESMHDAVQRESLATRRSVGVLDASTLGKIDIQGPDAARFLEMIYTNNWLKLGIGKCRYGLMLNEHGMVFDDGVTTRLGEHHYHMTTTTGGAARVMNWLEEWLQTEWPDMQVYCTSVTEQWAVAAINGPQAPALLASLADTDLSDEAFPHMSYREMAVAGIPARVFRISFTGEQAYEINVPARYGLALWQALTEAGRPLDLCVYGTETMHLLRAEKGFIIVGQDTDGTVTPADLGMNWIVSKTKRDYLGKRSQSRSHTAGGGRRQLVGLLTEDRRTLLDEGVHLVARADSAPPVSAEGHVTSSYLSPNVGRPIAMGLVREGLSRYGETLYARTMQGDSIKVRIVKPEFIDADGGAVHG